MGELTSGDPLARPEDEPEPTPDDLAPSDQTPDEQEDEEQGGVATLLIAGAVGLFAAYKALRWVIGWVWSLRGVDEVGPWVADHWLLLLALFVGIGVSAGLLTRALLPWVQRRLSSRSR